MVASIRNTVFYKFIEFRGIIGVNLIFSRDGTLCCRYLRIKTTCKRKENFDGHAGMHNERKE